MERTKKRALELADLIASNEVPLSKSVDKARQELDECLQKVDPQTQKEVMERIRGFD